MLKALVTIGLLQLATMLVQLVRTKTLALALGPEQVGVMAVVDKLLAVIVQTVSLSLPFAALRFLPGRWTEHPAAYAALYRRMRRVLGTLSVLAAGFALTVTAVRPAWWGAELLPYRSVVVAASLAIPALVLFPFLEGAVAGRLQENRSMLVRFGQATAMTTAVLGVWWRGLTGYYLAYAALGLTLVSGIGRMAGRVPPAAASGRPPPPEPRGPIGLPRPVWRFSGMLLPLTFLAPYAALFLHYSILRERGAEGAGWMQAAMGIGLAVRLLVGSAHSVFLTPNVNRGGEPGERMAWADRFQETFCLLAAVLLPPLLLFPQLAVALLYSRAFLPGAAFVGLFVLAEVLTLLSGTYQSLIIALDHLGFHVLQNLAAQALIVGAAALLIRPFGILGAGLALLTAPLFLFTATTTFLRRRHGLRVGARARRLGLLLTAMLLAAGAAGAAMAAFSPQGIALKLTLYAAMLGGMSLVLTPDERTGLRLAASRAGLTRLLPGRGDA